MQPDMIHHAVHALQLLLEPARLMFLFLGVLIGLRSACCPVSTASSAWRC